MTFYLKTLRVRVLLIRLIVIILLTVVSLYRVSPANIIVLPRENVSPNRVWFQNDSFDRKASPEEILRLYGFREMLERGELVLDTKLEIPSGEVLRYDQFYCGFPVVGAGVTLKIDRRGQPVSLFNSTSRWKSEAKPTCIITHDQAIETALDYTGTKLIRAEITAREKILSMKNTPVFCWQVRIPSDQPVADWEIFVDASDGQIILAENLLRHLNGTGRVFNPDPITALHDPSLEDEEDAGEAIPAEAYTEVELLDISEVENRVVLTGVWVDTSPTEDRARMEQPDFLFTRDNDHFEEGMAYYHIDTRARYLNGLGYRDILPSPQGINVNGIDADESFYSPFRGLITTGSGGVDDAEDADVLIHEYGHALLQQILPYWRGGDVLVLSEGWCDYQAGDYSLTIDDQFQPMLLFNWDGHNEFWEGRILDSDYKYPDILGLNPHDAGQMWSSLLIEVRQANHETDLWNMIAIDHLFSLGDSATVTDAAQALLASDLELAEGIFRPSLIYAFEDREIFPPGLYSPRISHQPLPDIEDVNVERLLSVRIESRFGINPDLTWVVTQTGGGDPDTVLLVQEEEEDVFQALIDAPGESAEMQYYICATDTLGVCSTDPPGAPMIQHRYLAGPDRIPPSVVEMDSIPNTVFPEGETVFATRVSDNIGLAEVSLLWYRDWGEPAGIILLEQNVEDSLLFTGRFRWQARDGERVQYAVLAVDAAVEQNATLTRRRAFDIQRDAVLDDFETVNHRWNIEGWVRTNRISHHGDWCLVDRCEDTTSNERVTVAELNEEWDLSRFGRFRLNFWEAHRFDEQINEYGLVEISSDSGISWESVLEVTGDQPFWMLREINLDGYCGEGSQPVRLRFLTHTPANALRMEGWFIDSVGLSTEIIVTTDEKGSGLPVTPVLSAPYPNPTNGRFYIDCSIPQPDRIILLDAAGREVMSLPIPTGNRILSVDMNTLPNGVYLITLESESLLKQKRIIYLK